MCVCVCLFVCVCVCVPAARARAFVSDSHPTNINMCVGASASVYVRTSADSGVRVCDLEHVTIGFAHVRVCVCV